MCTLQATKHGRHMFLAAPGLEKALHGLLATELLRSAALQTAKANTPHVLQQGSAPQTEGAARAETAAEKVEWK